MRVRIAVAALVAATGASFAEGFVRRPPISSVEPSLQGQKAWGFLAPAAVVSRNDARPATAMSAHRPRAERSGR